jgi:hypothetical protein
MPFAAQKSQQSKGFWASVKEWFNKIRQKSPSAGELATTAGVGATFIGKVNPYTSLQHAGGNYLIYQGVTKAWQAILDGNVTGSAAASLLLTAGLGISTFPALKYMTSSLENQKEILATGQKSIAIIALGIPAVGLISAVYHNVMAPIYRGEIEQIIIIKQIVKHIVRDMIEAALADEIAYPTPSTKINALLKRTDFLQGDDTDKIILEVCSDLIGDQKYSPKLSSPEQIKIDKNIDLLKEMMATNKITDIVHQIQFLKEQILEQNTDAYKRAVMSLLVRLQNRLALDLKRKAEARRKLTPEQAKNIGEYAKERTELYNK